MYWPYGVPRIYAPSNIPKQGLELESVIEGAATEVNSNVSPPVHDDGTIVGLRASRSGHVFATITKTSLTVWQSRPTAVLASYSRSPESLEKYGTNISLLLKPDCSIIAVQTSESYLITFNVSADVDSRVYRQEFEEGRPHRHGRHGSTAEEDGMVEVIIRFRVIIKIDAGIRKVVALDDELVVATTNPPAIQCIRWNPNHQGTQASAEVSLKLSRIPWISKDTVVVDMVHDKAMNLAIWITNDGKAYAVQRVLPSMEDQKGPKRLFRGYCFHNPKDDTEYATKAAVNARFSLLAIGCANGSIQVYTAKDYVGSIPLSHSLQTSGSTWKTGGITLLTYSPDGYCLFAGFNEGWMTWSTYGKIGGSSFTQDASPSDENEELWLRGIRDGIWMTNGSQLLLLGKNDERLWLLEFLHSAMTGCLSSGNLSRTMLQSSSGLMIYRGYDLPDLTTISGESSLWHHAQYPTSYLNRQWPIRTTVISPDGRYVAIAGRRGLAHYSIHSGRWKTFDDPFVENSFAVRGGMCWYQHVLIAATESDQCYEVRLYSRELHLDDSSITYSEILPAPAVTIASSGEDSLLVYTYENILYHYVIAPTAGGICLVQVGQIAFHGIIRSPTRVRSVSWILPDNQLRDGDPSQDVSVASSLFLVDAKLVLLRPSRTDSGALKYDMRVVAQNVEYFVLMRDQLSFNFLAANGENPDSPATELGLNNYRYNHPIRDSLWVFDGQDLRMWTDIQDVLRLNPEQAPVDASSPIQVPVDFYPLSIMLNKGIVLGIEPELVRRRDFKFPYFRISIRSHLFLPNVLRHHLSQGDASAALHLSHYYEQLSYFPHALEILLHDVLDEEVDRSPSSEGSTLPSIISFLSTFPQYLDVVVQCTRKTEVRSWRTLFAYLPPPQELFEQSLQRGSLKTAGGYLIVLHTFEELGSSSQQLIKLLRRAKKAGDWDLCKELARFLIALDETGSTLREALDAVDFSDSSSEDGLGISGVSRNGRLGSDLTITGPMSGLSGSSGSPQSFGSSENAGTSAEDYFSSMD
ncbi:MAG: hypothetical protein M1834_008077 [Cirrosporium novae-zelandiae]|nr:MAG: hypothetical protein M1834_008077 [Cirrosporium novae-zelandiae]